MARDRERIEPTPGDKRYIRRDEQGQFEEVEDSGRLSARDQKKDSRTESTPGQGDRAIAIPAPRGPFRTRRRRFEAIGASGDRGPGRFGRPRPVGSPPGAFGRE